MPGFRIKEEIPEEVSKDDRNAYFLPSPKKRKRRTNKPKVVSVWSDSNVLKLIACVRKRPTLWDVRDSQYQDKHERTKLWNQISKKEFKSKFAEAELLAKWSNIRIQFRSYANKKMKSDDATAPPIKWKFFSAMQFIGRSDCEQIAATRSKLILTCDTLINTAVNKQKSNTDLEPQRCQNRQLSNIASTSSASTLNSSAASIGSESMKTAMETFKQTKEPICDEFEAFGKYLASELRSLGDVEMARRIKRRVNRFFLDAVDEEQRTN